MTATATAPRSLRDIAQDIQFHWTEVWYGAKPYLDAMATLDAITDTYYADSAVSVVLYFLANASTFRGEHARRLKTELKALLTGIDEVR